MIWLIAFSAIFLFVTLPVSTFFRANEKNFDENRCYFPAIEQLRVKFPKVDLVQDSLSASPPGYTQLLAGLSLVSGDSISWIRVWHNLISWLGAGVLLWLMAKFSRSHAILLFTPALLSVYYLKQSCVLSTDNVSLILAGISLGILAFQRHNTFWCVIAGLLLILAIYFRQITAWLLVPLTLVILLKDPVSKKRGISLLLTLVLACGLGLLALLFFFWQGMVPPRFQSAHAGLSLSGVVYGLCLLAILAPFFFDKNVLWPKGEERKRACYAGLAGLFLFVATPSSYSYEEGRWGGALWTLAKHMPAVLDRSILLLPLTVCGAVFGCQIFMKIRETERNTALIWASAVLAWLASSIPNAQVFHRYFEGPILLFLGLAGCLTPKDREKTSFKIFALCSLFFVAAIFALYFTDNGFQSGPLLRIPRP